MSTEKSIGNTSNYLLSADEWKKRRGTSAVMNGKLTAQTHGNNDSLGFTCPSCGASPWNGIGLEGIEHDGKGAATAVVFRFSCPRCLCRDYFAIPVSEYTRQKDGRDDPAGWWRTGTDDWKSAYKADEDYYAES